jgi:putative hemolysin
MAVNQARHLSQPAGSPPGDAPRRFEVRWADCEDDVRAAQRLRYLVFTQEMNPDPAPSPRAPAHSPQHSSQHSSRHSSQHSSLSAGDAPGLDADRFDPFCDHLLVRALADGPRDGAGLLVGTYRVLAPAAASRAGGFYTDTEFDLTPVAPLRARAAELGRSCVHPAWRSGAVIMSLWTALGGYMLAHRIDTMIGCASIGLGDGGRTADLVWRRLRRTHLAPAQWRVTPLTAFSPQAAVVDSPAGPHAPRHMAEVPPLIKGYLRCGARVLGPPAFDAVFNTADLPMMLRTRDLDPRYGKRFFSA